ncbi:MAG: ATP-binding cassette domain-containing protein [Desulfobacterales bacterium]
MIELIDYTIAPERAGKGLRDVDFSLSKGDVCAIRTDSPADAGTLLKALATLIHPERGSYRLEGNLLDFTDYRSLLPIKKRIGYIASDAAMISNRSIRDNLLLMRQYYENSLDVTLDKASEDLCRNFELDHLLDLRPGELTLSALRRAIATRELAKSPTMLFIEYPEDYIGLAHLDYFSKTLEALPLSEMAVAVSSDDKHFLDRFANRQVTLSAGTLKCE